VKSSAALSMASLPAELAGLRLALLPCGGAVPLVISPTDDPSVEGLCRRLDAERERMAELLLHHGALLLRGFAISTAAAFERVARTIAPDLKNRYLGTSPRNALTEYVFSASELPSYFPIPLHCEMSFVAEPPHRLFFWCEEASRGPGGETPLCDMRRVYRELDPAVRRRFEERGLRIIRNYTGPEARGGKRFDLWRLKRWDEMFQTTDRAAVEALCRDEGFEPTWKPGGELRLVGRQPAVRQHPVSGEPVWFNHANVFHLWSAPAEYRHIAARQRPLAHHLLGLVARIGVGLKRRRLGALDQAMHVTFGDGGEIADDDIEHVLDVLWRNMAAFRWQDGDVVVIDNRAVAHGRLPYRGPRRIAVCWA
jgi:alpha-ketoglutarate-dependent taurine dioxygenase